MNLRYDPFQVFRSSKTPAGLYARQKWLGEAGSPQWKIDFQQFDRAAFHNIFRAMVVHPVFAKDKATELAVEVLAALAAEDGGWGNDSTFYQTLNAVAHLELSQAQSALEKAFERLFETQRIDGSWGRSQPEWNTFLAVHALKNKGFI